MAQELVYTSTRRGLRTGTTGFCTVACTRGMGPNYVQFLENLSAYEWVYLPPDPKERLNPVAFSHYAVSLGGLPLSVLSRVASAGVDHDGRSNKIAHHVLLAPEERPAAGPAWLQSRPRWHTDAWQGDPAYIERIKSVPAGDDPPAPCSAWQTAVGNPDWAGVIAHAAAGDETAWIIYDVGADPITLLAEALRLVPPAKRWNVTYSTYFSDAPHGSTCLWRCCLRGSPALKIMRRTASPLIIDLAAGDAQAELARARLEPAADYVRAARTGEPVPDHHPVEPSRGASRRRVYSVRRGAAGDHAADAEPELQLERDAAPRAPSAVGRRADLGLPTRPGRKGVPVALIVAFAVIMLGGGAAILMKVTGNGSPRSLAELHPELNTPGPTHPGTEPIDTRPGPPTRPSGAEDLLKGLDELDRGDPDKARRLAAERAAEAEAARFKAQAAAEAEADAETHRVAAERRAAEALKAQREAAAKLARHRFFPGRPAGMRDRENLAAMFGMADTTLALPVPGITPDWHVARACDWNGDTVDLGRGTSVHPAGGALTIKARSAGGLDEFDVVTFRTAKGSLEVAKNVNAANNQIETCLNAVKLVQLAHPQLDKTHAVWVVLNGHPGVITLASVKNSATKLKGTAPSPTVMREIAEKLAWPTQLRDTAQYIAKITRVAAHGNDIALDIEYQYAAIADLPDVVKTDREIRTLQAAHARTVGQLKNAREALNKARRPVDQAESALAKFLGKDIEHRITRLRSDITKIDRIKPPPHKGPPSE